MTRRLLRRLGAGIVTVFFVYTLTFAMVVSIPGNPLQSGERKMSREVEAALRARYHMDSNWRYFADFLGGALQGDLGPSFSYPDWNCNQIIASALPVSMLVGGLAIVVASLLGVPLGVVSAARQGEWIDAAFLSTTLIFISIPTFVIGAFLLYVFAVRLHWAPIGGWGTFLHLPLPVLTLSLPFLAYITRLMRAGMIESLGSDYIRTAIAKGVSPNVAIWKHAFKPAFLPVLSYLGPATAQAMTGSFVVEKVFGVPGLGQHFVNAALNRDPGLILSTVLVFSALMVAFNVVIDLLCAWLDPRIAEAV